MPESQRDALKIIDNALAGIDDALAIKYPGLALSRRSLLGLRQQVLRSRPTTDFVAAPAVAAPDAPNWLLESMVPKAAADAFVKTIRQILTGLSYTSPVALLAAFGQREDLSGTSGPLGLQLLGSLSPPTGSTALWASAGQDTLAAITQWLWSAD